VRKEAKEKLRRMSSYSFTFRPASCKGFKWAGKHGTNVRQEKRQTAQKRCVELVLLHLQARLL